MSEDDLRQICKDYGCKYYKDKEKLISNLFKKLKIEE